VIKNKKVIKNSKFLQTGATGFDTKVNELEQFFKRSSVATPKTSGTTTP
jgi:hypothetical protein